MGVGLGVVLFGVFGAVIFKGSLQEQYFATIAIGLGVIFMPLSRRLVAPISDARRRDYLPFQQFGTPHRSKILLELLSFSTPKVPLGITYHGWMPGCWLRDGTLYSLAGTISYGTPANDEVLLNTTDRRE